MSEQGGEFVPVPMVEFLLDLMAEGWLPHPFLQHMSDKCALCGATADRAVHDRTFATQQGLWWHSVLTSVPALQGASHE